MFRRPAEEKHPKDLGSCLFSGDLVAAGELLAQGTDINKADEFGHYAIASVMESGFPESLRFFIRNGGNVNQDTGNGWTALHIVVDLAIDGMLQTGSSQPNDTAMEMIGILLANGADLNNRSINGEAPLDILNAYAADILGFNTLKNFFRGLITDIDTRVVFLEHE